MFKRLAESHRQLKKKIHTTKFLLPPSGIFVMKLVYFFTPIAFGFWLLNATDGMAEERWKRRMEEEPDKYRSFLVEKEEYERKMMKVKEDFEKFKNSK